MKKSKKRRSNSAKPASLRDSIEAPTKDALPRRRTLSFSAAIWGGWKGFWAFVGPIVSITGFYFLLAPQILVEPSVNLDPLQPLSTQLLVKNVGRVPVRDVRFGWSLGGGNSVMIGSLLLGPTLLPIANLPAGGAATRSLALASSDISAQDIAFRVAYRWPLIGWESVETFHFSIRRGAPGFFLVPDVTH